MDGYYFTRSKKGAGQKTKTSAAGGSSIKRQKAKLNLPVSETHVEDGMLDIYSKEVSPALVW